MSVQPWVAVALLLAIIGAGLLAWIVWTAWRHRHER
jgi:threonine/homoserine/homoserine lactone efflux protein